MINPKGDTTVSNRETSPPPSTTDLNSTEEKINYSASSVFNTIREFFSSILNWFSSNQLNFSNKYFTPDQQTELLTAGYSEEEIIDCANKTEEYKEKAEIWTKKAEEIINELNHNPSQEIAAKAESFIRTSNIPCRPTESSNILLVINPERSDKVTASFFRSEIEKTRDQVLEKRKRINNLLQTQSKTIESKATTATDKFTLRISWSSIYQTLLSLFCTSTASTSISASVSFNTTPEQIVYDTEEAPDKIKKNIANQI